MLPTVEVRWFLRGPLPESARAWFDGLADRSEVEERTDRYVATEAVDLGVKVRERRLEVKRRTGVLGPGRWGSAAGRVEAWEKWSLELAAGARPPDWIAVHKKRWLVRLRVKEEAVRPVPQLGPRTPGANVELSEVRLEDAAWWCVCLEAYGPGEAERRDALDRVAATVFAERPPPGLKAATSMGYPAWLAREAAR
jgi:hypothetical protein